MSVDFQKNGTLYRLFFILLKQPAKTNLYSNSRTSLKFEGLHSQKIWNTSMLEKMCKFPYIFNYGLWARGAVQNVITELLFFV
jgi:hypothetical protein